MRLDFFFFRSVNDGDVCCVYLRRLPKCGYEIKYRMHSETWTSDKQQILFLTSLSQILHATSATFLLLLLFNWIFNLTGNPVFLFATFVIYPLALN